MRNRLIRLTLPLLFAFGGIIALVAAVRSEAWAQQGAPSTMYPVHQGSLRPQSGGGDLSITKTHTTPLILGQVTTYTLFVKNVGAAITPPYLVKITDTLPIPSLAYQAHQGTGWNCTVITPTIGCQYALTQTLNSNAFLPPLKIIVSVKQPTPSSFNNVVIISDTLGTNNTFTDPAIISTNLSITKSAFPGVITPTRTVTFTLQVKNNGPNDASSVRVTDTLPSVFIFSAAKPSGQYNPATGLWSVGSLAKNETKTLEIAAVVRDRICGQLYTNSVEGLSADLVDPILSDNTASASVTVRNTCVVGRVVRSDNTSIPIQNARVRITDSGNRVYTITVSADGVFTFTNSTTQTLAAGNATFLASAVGFRPKSVSSSLVADIKNGPIIIPLDPIAQLDLRKSDGTLHFIPGETITYTIPITNLGVLNARNLVISDVLDSQLIFITYTLRDKSGKIPHVVPTPVNRVYTWTLSSSYILTATEKLTLAIRVRVADPLASGTNQIDNKVSLRYNEDNTSRVNKSATDISYTPNFEIVQNSVNPTEARINERFTFSFRVYNRQPQVAATNVVFTNTFPAYLSFYSSSPTGSYNNNNRVFSVDLGTIPPNSFKDVQIVMSVSNVAASTQTLNNTGTARFEHGGKRQWRSSNTVQYRILGTSTLPGTGFGPPAAVKSVGNLFEPQESKAPPFAFLQLFQEAKGRKPLTHPLNLTEGRNPSRDSLALPLAFWVAMGIGILLLGGGLLGVAYSLLDRSSEWSSWARQMGLVVMFASLFFFGGALWLRSIAAPVQSEEFIRSPQPVPTLLSQLPEPALPPPEWWAAQPESLPDYPIPTPTLAADQAGVEVDDTPPVRLLIPKLGVDAVIKYVPFDGFTWLISGLQDEIAWMGSTSWPGLGGNTGLAGHVTLRNGADGPFRYLDALQKGDIVHLYTQERLYTYRVRESLIVKDDDFSVVQPTSEPTLTLITCTGWNDDFGHYLERLVIRATLEKSQPLSGAGPLGWPIWGFGWLGGN
ncbi:MAG: sortase [Anaerolineales bacterium]|nr:sortase [Anaerolineales bacterium]MDW8161949.1 sortase [Anaerolineales bacterium]